MFSLFPPGYAGVGISWYEVTAYYEIATVLCASQ